MDWSTILYFSLLVASVWPWLEKGSSSSLGSSSSESESAPLSGVSALEVAALSQVLPAAWLWDDRDPPNLGSNKHFQCICNFKHRAETNNSKTYCWERLDLCCVSDLLRDLACVAKLISFSSQMSSSSSSNGWILSLEQASNTAVLACKRQVNKSNALS